jgi:two-component system, sensor histidine kinase LadS
VLKGENPPVKSIQAFFVFIALVLGMANVCCAQKAVALSDEIQQYIFSFSEIEYLEDSAGRLTVQEVTSGIFNDRFTPSETFNPENY